MSLQILKMSTQIEPMPADIDHLLDQRKVLRILQPTLRQQIENALRRNPALTDYVVYHRSEMYLSLESIHNAERRAQFYDLIQWYQIDPDVDLHKLPSGLRACLQPKQNRQGRLMGALVLGALAGILLGLMGMAVGVLVTAVFGMPNENVETMVVTVTFIICCTFGWAAATYYFWHKHPLGFWQH